MPQVFGRSSNVLARASFVFAGVGLLAIFLIGSNITPYMHRVGSALDQPAPFSHKHHWDELGIDCRYCHTGVETSPFAGIPPTETCMTCHSQIWTNSPLLEVVRQSYTTGKPIEWNRVNDVPDFVYFDHSVHVKKGVSCFSCHGRIDKMNLTFKEKAFEMIWCLECHREPERQIRPQAELFNPNYPAQNHAQVGRELVQKYGIKKEQLTNCWVCHR